ncbi:hypothetical protein [Nocardia brasiliensis]|uniref:hypothetical protein n=1 Tax=Nocardia brasiliensis TaxID=37326 RepID=UPI002455CF4F|nr:hypothetical protein [Nocardia brasiliensis]
MSNEGDVAGREQRVRAFGLVALALAPTTIACGLLFTFVGEYAGVGAAQRVTIGLALAVEALAIIACWRRPPAGGALVAVRTAFFGTYAAVAIAAVLTIRDENWEILSIPIYLMLIFSLHALYERCTRQFEAFRRQTD